MKKKKNKILYFVFALVIAILLFDDCAERRKPGGNT